MSAGFPTLVSLWPNQCEAVHDGLRCMRRAGHPPTELLPLDDGSYGFLSEDWHWNGVGFDKNVWWMDDIRDRINRSLGVQS